MWRAESHSVSQPQSNNRHPHSYLRHVYDCHRSSRCQSRNHHKNHYCYGQPRASCPLLIHKYFAHPGNYHHLRSARLTVVPQSLALSQFSLIPTQRALVARIAAYSLSVHQGWENYLLPPLGPGLWLTYFLGFWGPGLPGPTGFFCTCITSFF